MLPIPIVYTLENFLLGKRERQTDAIMVRKALPSILMAAFLLLYAPNLYSAFAYHIKPANENLLGSKTRFELYFSGVSSLTPYRNVCSVIDEKGYGSLGLLTDRDAYQYPILARYALSGRKTENIQTTPEGENLNEGEDAFQPDAIITAYRAVDPQKSLSLNGAVYHCVYDDLANNYLSVWEKDE